MTSRCATPDTYSVEGSERVGGSNEEGLVDARMVHVVCYRSQDGRQLLHGRKVLSQLQGKQTGQM